MRMSLRYKAALLIAIAELALLALLVVSNLYQSRRDLNEEIDLHARATADLLAASAREPLLAYDLAQLQNLIAGSINKHRVRYAAIADHRGQLLAQAGEPAPATQAVEARQPILVADSRFGEVTLQISRMETEQALARTTQSNLLIAGLEVALVAAISLTLGWFLTRDIGALSRAAQSIAAGDYSTRVPVTGGDEVADLARHFNDMTAQLQRTVDDLARSEHRFRDLADNTSDWLWETDNAGRYTYVSKRAQELLGYPVAELVGRPAFDFMLAEDAKRLQAQFAIAREQRRGFYGFEYRGRRRDGALVTLEANGIPIADAVGELTGYRGVTRDISRRKEDEARLVYLAEHDTTTGLKSRQKFLDTLDQELRLAARAPLPLALLLIDIDGFKLLNDTHGHVAGDSLLYVVAQLLRTHATDGEVIARLGADEFGVLLRGGEAEATTLAQRLLAAFTQAEFAVRQTTVHLSAGIGICTYPRGGGDSETLLANADLALARAKALGHNHYYIYCATDYDRERIETAMNWRGLIQEALQFDRLLVQLQPMVCVSGVSRRPHYEALVRLRDSQRRVIVAGQFIDTAEHTGQVAEVDRWVLHNVLRLLAQPALADAVVSLNLSGRSLNSPGFLDYFEREVGRSKVAPSQLVFELTESVAIAEMTKAENFISAMKRRGYRFALDDFGTGFSSLAYLKHLPVDQIKIDGSFIRQLDVRREDQILVRALIQVARELGLETVAEGVETKAVFDLLIEMGVDFVQGYFLGKPAAPPVSQSLAGNDH